MTFPEGNRGPQARTEAQAYLIGYVAEDPAGKKIGAVQAVWADAKGQPAFVAIATGWLGLRRIHVVPAHAATVSEADRYIAFPFTARCIARGPAFEADYALTPEGERLVAAYYRDQVRAGDADFNPDPGDPSLYTGIDPDRGATPSQ